MKTRNGLLIIVGLVCIALAVVLYARQSDRPHGRKDPHATPIAQQNRVPAHYKEPPARSELGPTLAPERFTGKTREAYRVVREIPQTIAQLPCYCYCDEGHGHKSLYSCFEDEHAGSCAVCVQEALVAYRMEKEVGLSAPQIRERIIATFGRNN